MQTFFIWVNVTFADCKTFPTIIIPSCKLPTHPYKCVMEKYHPTEALKSSELISSPYWKNLNKISFLICLIFDFDNTVG